MFKFKFAVVSVDICFHKISYYHTRCLWGWRHDSESLHEVTWFTRWMQNSARWLSTFGPSRRTRAIGPLVAAKKLHPPSPSLLLSRKADTHFYHPTEGRRLSRPRTWLSYWLQHHIYLHKCSAWFASENAKQHHSPITNEKKHSPITRAAAGISDSGTRGLLRSEADAEWTVLLELTTYSSNSRNIFEPSCDCRF